MVRSLGQKLRSVAELARVSNLPTCISNVLVGCAAGAGQENLTWPPVMTVMVSVCLFYMGGMILNDVVDAQSDLLERPDRPIPSGRISRPIAMILAVAALVGALTVLLIRLPHAVLLAVGLAVMIVLYDLLHKRWAGAVMLMGACRGLVYITAAVAVGGAIGAAKPVLFFAGAMILYTIGLSLVARKETAAWIGPCRWVAIVMPVLIVLPAAKVQPAAWTWTVAAAAATFLWLARAGWWVLRARLKTMQAVLVWLSGMCLADMVWLCLLDRPLLAIAAAVCFIITALGHLSIKGT